jgi:hypothetical protein
MHEANAQNETDQPIKYELGAMDRLAITIDQPMGVGTLFLKALFNGLVTAFTTAAVFKGFEYLKDRRERKEQELSLVQGGAGNYRVAGE